MWKEYADQLGKTVSQLTDAEKRQAEINGIMQETRHQVGDLTRLQNSLAGELSKASAAGRDTAAAFGDALEPAASAVAAGYSAIMLGVKEFISNNPGVVAGATAGALAFTGLSTGLAGVSALLPKITAGFKALFVSSGPIGWGIIAITALTAAIVGLRTAQEKQLEKMRETSKEYSQQSSEIYDLVTEYELLAEKTEKTAEEKERLKEVTERLIELSPDVVKGYDDEGNAILDLNIALEEMVEKKREALRVDQQLIDRQIKDQERVIHQLRMQRADLVRDMEREQGTMSGLEFSQETIDQMASAYQAEIAKIDELIADEEAKLAELAAKSQQIAGAIEGTTVEALRAEYERRRKEQEERRKALEEAHREEERKKQEEAERQKREKLEAELADRIFELTRKETEVKIRELDKQKEAYKKAKISEIEIDGQKFTLAQWYDLELTKINDEEARKQQQIAEELAKWQEDWQNRARLVMMEEYERRVAQYELDREAALKEAKKKLEDEEQYKQAELAINQYYDALIAQVRAEQDEEEKRARDQRIRDTEEAIRKEYGLEQQLTEWEKKELLQRLQNELTALEAMEEASAERIEAMKNVIDDLSREIPDLTDMTRQWTEGLVDGLSQAIVRGESLSDVFENLLQTITQYLLKQAMMGGLSAIGFPTFHGGGEVQRFHWGGVVDAFAGAIRAHGGLKLAADEVPIIAQTGERVLSRAQNVAYEAGWKPQVKIDITNNTGTPIQAEPEVSFDGAEMVVSLLLEGHRRNIGGIQKLLPFRR